MWKFGDLVTVFRLGERIDGVILAGPDEEDGSFKVGLSNGEWGYFKPALIVRRVVTVARPDMLEFEGNKIRAIKALRDMFAAHNAMLELRDAKDFVETVMRIKPYAETAQAVDIDAMRTENARLRKLLNYALDRLDRSDLIDMLASQ